jgi:hypothetical protein
LKSRSWHIISPLKFSVGLSIQEVVWRLKKIMHHLSICICSRRLCISSGYPVASMNVTDYFLTSIWNLSQSTKMW